MAKTTTSNANLSTMKNALIWAHDVMMNSHAINEKDLEEANLTHQSFDTWCAYVEELRTACKAYLPVAESKESTDEDIEKALGAVWAAWRRVCKEGAESSFNKNFFVRRNDANTLAEWAGRKAQKTAKGKNWAPKGEADFRREVETLIGIRMTGNAVLTDEQRDCISAYEGAIRTIKSREDALKDTVIKGKTVAGLRSVAKAKQKELDEHEAMLTELGVSDEKMQKLLDAYRVALSTANRAVADAEADIKKYEKVRDDNKENYDKTIALLKSIGADK